MNISAPDFPPQVSVLELARLHVAPSVHIATPRVAEAAVGLECRLHQMQPLGRNTLIIGQVVMFHVDDPLIDARMRIHNFSSVGRMGSPSMYCCATERLKLDRLSYAQWQGKESKES